MRFLSHLLALAVGASLVAFYAAQKLGPLRRQQAQMELLHMRAAVQRYLELRSASLVHQLHAFGEQMASDRDVAMKVLVEHDATAPEVTEFASRYMTAMGLQLLEVTDSTGTILSCGHFPAAAGTRSGFPKFFPDTISAHFILDTLKGVESLTLQANVTFTLGDSLSLRCTGGWVIDKEFLASIPLPPSVRILLRVGSRSVGIDSITTLSPIINNTIVINDTVYLATGLPLAYLGAGAIPELVLISDMPPRFSLF